MKNTKMILIVDDNAENRKLLGSLLVKAGYEVGVAKDGNSALEFLKNERPNLILLDVMMPGMDGFEVCSIIKSESRTRYIPIIFITAKTSTEDIVKGFKIGGVDYITKPFKQEELLARVNTHVELNFLRGMLPICSSCKSIRDDEGYWHSIEEYLQSNSSVEFSHSLCDACVEKLYGDEPWFIKSKLKKELSSKKKDD